MQRTKLAQLRFFAMANCASGVLQQTGLLPVVTGLAWGHAPSAEIVFVADIGVLGELPAQRYSAHP